MKEGGCFAVKDGTMYHRRICPTLRSVKEEDWIPYKDETRAEAYDYYPCGMCYPDKN
ncbi:MAG: hypothetical protein WCG06_03100 [Candidatus Omnitrophota bacterium]